MDEDKIIIDADPNVGPMDITVEYIPEEIEGDNGIIEYYDSEGNLTIINTNDEGNKT